MLKNKEKLNNWFWSVRRELKDNGELMVEISKWLKATLNVCDYAILENKRMF